MKKQAPGHYSEEYKGHHIEVMKVEPDFPGAGYGASPIWNVFIDGTCDFCEDTKKQAQASARNCVDFEARMEEKCPGLKY